MILLIDTAQETGTTALCQGGEVLFSEENKIAKEHASWLHLAIGRILSEAKITIRELKAVAVVSGPGSYTGLRVGMAAAKGFCFALKIPLITQNTLRVMAESMIPYAIEKQALICPLIDARRDEVFTALYRLDAQRLTPNDQRLTPNAESQPPTVNRQLSTVNRQLPTVNRQPPTVNRQPPTVNPQLSTVNPQLSTVNRQPPTVNPQLSTVNRQLSTVLPPQALILDKSAFESELAGDPIIFFGTGAEKWKKITDSPNALFQAQPNLMQAFARLAQSDFDAGILADPVYAEPVYLKEFFSY